MTDDDKIYMWIRLQTHWNGLLFFIRSSLVISWARKTVECIYSLGIYDLESEFRDINTQIYAAEQMN